MYNNKGFAQGCSDAKARAASFFSMLITPAKLNERIEKKNVRIEVIIIFEQLSHEITNFCLEQEF